MRDTTEFIEKAHERLKRFKRSGSFKFHINDKLSDVCNAPEDGVGLYIITGKSGSSTDLFSIGHSGKILDNGEVKPRKKGFRDRLVNGKEQGLPGEQDRSRNLLWSIKLKFYSVDELRVYWYITVDSDNKVCPRLLRNELLNSFKGQFGFKPEWK